MVDCSTEEEEQVVVRGRQEVNQRGHLGVDLLLEWTTENERVQSTEAVNIVDWLRQERKL